MIKNKNMKIKNFLILTLLIIVSCKTKTPMQNSDDNCFYEKDGFVYINFYNLSNKPKLIPSISNIMDENFYILKQNYHLENDTLIIHLLDKRNINISDINSESVLIKVKDSVLMKKKGRVQQAFKNNEKFSVVAFTRDGKKSFFNKCN